MSDAACFLVAAPASGSGKTTVCRGLMAALVRRGLKVQPFKCGPDYIDTKFHEAVCGRPSVNLDTFMATPQHVRELFARYSEGADVCVVEGMMGLFDGYDHSRGSSAEIAEVLGLPVVLVVDARSAAYSVAALLTGFARFREQTRIAGVIFNKVGSERHAEMLREACADASLPCLGCLPQDKTLQQRERYLGLDFSQPAATAAHLAEWIERHIDLRALTAPLNPPKGGTYNTGSGVISPPFGGIEGGYFGEGFEGGSCILRNSESFSFIYTEHIDLLRQMGQVTFLDPESDEPLPDGIDFLYLPGGYPERHAVQLSRAVRTMRSIRDYIERGGRALAECGGMIYLSQGILFDEEPRFVPLCGVLPFAITNRKADRKLSLGYRQFQYKGKQFRGHEFHYTQIEALKAPLNPPKGGTYGSQVEGYSTDYLTTNYLTSVSPPFGGIEGGFGEGFEGGCYDARLRPVPTPIFRYKNLMASYTHLYLPALYD